MLNLDTHVLLHAVGGKLTPTEDRLLRADRWSISAIVIWEIARLAQLKRIDLDLDDSEVFRVLGTLHVWPITVEVARLSTKLDIQSDPADELICATSIAHNVRLVTRDRKILSSKLVPLA